MKDLTSVLALLALIFLILALAAVAIFGHDFLELIQAKPKTRYKADKEHVKDWKLRKRYPGAFAPEEPAAFECSYPLSPLKPLSAFPVLARPRGRLPRGRLPKRSRGARLPLKWAHEYLKAPLPAPSYPIDVSAGITDWGMYGNAQWGDCFAAALAHYQMTTAAAAKTQGPPLSTTGLRTVAVEWNTRYTGVSTSPGPGAVLATFLLWCYRKGIIRAFAPVDDSTLAQSDAFMAAGFGLYVGVNLTAQAETDFNRGLPWSGTIPDPTDGHCVLRTKAMGNTLTDTATYVTWGAEQPATRAWTKACVDECWLIVTTQEQASLFTPQLMADVLALGGTG